MQPDLAEAKDLKASGLREERLRRGLTLEMLAFIAERDPATISRIERGLVEPERETIVRLARALGMSVARFRSLLPVSK